MSEATDLNNPSRPEEKSPKNAEPPSGGSSPRVAVPPPDWPVLIGSGALIVAIALWAILAPENAGNVINAVVGWVSANLGWYYILTAGLVVVFVIAIAVSRVGDVKLGPDHAKPQFKAFTWGAMLFAAGIGIDLMFFSVAEPVTQYYAPPAGSGETVEAARQAVVWTLFHYGITGWAMYALMGMAFGYFAYRRNMPLSIRSLLQPVLGRRVEGWLGRSIDITAVLGTVFGIAVTLGIGVVQLNYGLNLMFGIPEGAAAQAALIALSVLMATISTVSGVEKGIRRLSELNVVLAIVLIVWVTVTGQTRFLLDGLVMNVGEYLTSFPSMMLDTFAFIQPDTWMSSWTLFFWAWWIAWAPFVGLFLARISRGRTIRQFVAAVLAVPFAFIAIFVSVFGNSALSVVMNGGDAFGEVAMNSPERAFYSLLEQYPGAPLLIGLATFVGLLFYVTSADSGALVLSNFTSRITDSTQEGSKPLRVFWSVATGVLTLAMLLVGGVPTLQSATLIIGVPFSVIMYLVMLSLYRSLRLEIHQTEGYRTTLKGRSGQNTGPTLSWKQRMQRVMQFPSEAQAQRFVAHTVRPALEEVAAEMQKTVAGAELTVDEVEGCGVQQLELRVPFDGEQTFSYQIYPVRGDTPSFAYRSTGNVQSYFRLEVFTVTGSRGYDVYGFSRDQLIADVLNHYESHVEFLRLAHADAGSMPTSTGEVQQVWQNDFR